jgi:hypothetical protein
MRRVIENLDLAQLQKDGRGFILNIRDDVKKLHRAKCDAVTAMVSAAYPKYFFEEEEQDEALKWLDAEYGERGWSPCGYCRPNSKPFNPFKPTG